MPDRRRSRWWSCAVPSSVSPGRRTALQLHAGFRFDGRRGAGRLPGPRSGSSHLYCSPVLQAAPGSTHGYDVVDHSRVNEELGGAEGYAALRRRAARRAGWASSSTSCPTTWRSSPRTTAGGGTCSRTGPPAATPPTSTWTGTRRRRSCATSSSCPCSATTTAACWRRASSSARARTDGSFAVRYHEHAWPVAPRSVDGVLARGRRALRLRRAGLPRRRATGAWPRPRAHDDVAAMRRRHRDKEVLQAAARAPVPRAAARWRRRWTPRSRASTRDPDALDALLERQNYRLAFWRTASRDLGYRRFFDVNTLAGLRVEVERVFRDTHDLVLGWLRRAARWTACASTIPTACAIPPATSTACAARARAPGWWWRRSSTPGERLPEDWPVDGTTGYDFMARVSGALRGPRGRGAADRALRRAHGRARRLRGGPAREEAAGAARRPGQRRQPPDRPAGRACASATAATATTRATSCTRRCAR